jgi:hypothetical protein
MSTVVRFDRLGEAYLDLTGCPSMSVAASKTGPWTARHKVCGGRRGQRADSLRFCASIHWTLERVSIKDAKCYRCASRSTGPEQIPQLELIKFRAAGDDDEPSVAPFPKRPYTRERCNAEAGTRRRRIRVVISLVRSPSLNLKA